MPDDDNQNVVGLGSYATTSRSAAHTVMTKLEAKCRLRSELAKIEAELSAMVQALRPAELQALQQLIQQSADSADRDVAALQAEAAQELELSKTTRSGSVVVSRRTMAALSIEAEKRVARGNFPTISGLIQEAAERAFCESSS